MFLPDRQGHSCASAAGTQTMGPPATPFRVRACSWVGDARKGLRDDIRDSCLCPQVTGTSPGTHFLMRMLGSLGLAWDDDWISLSFGDGVYLSGNNYGKEMRAEEPDPLGTWTFSLGDDSEFAHRVSRERWRG